MFILDESASIHFTEHRFHTLFNVIYCYVFFASACVYARACVRACDLACVRAI